MLDDRYSPLLLLDHTERFQSLQIYGTEIAIMHFMVRLAERQFPVLRSINVDPYPWGVLPHHEILHPPDALFDGRAPTLRSLKLPQSYINWALLHHCLEDLSVKDDRLLVAPLPTFLSVLHALQRLPLLKTLKLCFLRPPDVARNSYLYVELPLLRILDVSADLKTCCALVSSLSIPTTASIRLYPREFSMSRNELQELLAPLRVHYFTKSAHVPRLIRIDCPGPYCIIRSYAETASPALLGTRSAYFTIQSETQNNVSQQIFISEVLRALALRSVTHLDTQWASDITEFSWSMIIHLLPVLDTIYLRNSISGENVGNALLQMLKTEQRFPRLRRLHLEAFYYSKDLMDVPQRVVGTLYQVLRRYWKLDAPVQVLEITNTSHISHILRAEDIQNKLCDLVETFILDGVVYDPVKVGGNHRGNEKRRG